MKKVFITLFLCVSSSVFAANLNEDSYGDENECPQDYTIQCGELGYNGVKLLFIEAFGPERGPVLCLSLFSFPVTAHHTLLLERQMLEEKKRAALDQLLKIFPKPL